MGIGLAPRPYIGGGPMFRYSAQLEKWMRRLAIGLIALLQSAILCAQDIPTVVQWIALFEEVRKHALFQDLHVTYAKMPAASAGYSPVGVIQREGVDCVIVISDGDNPKMAKMMKLPKTAPTSRAFLLAIAAHEFGHCFRIRGKHLTLELWERVARTTPDSPERETLEKLLSIEEAYADAYAFAYVQDVHPAMYSDVFQAMHSLRHEPVFATRFYRVEPLYVQLGSRGLDTSLPLHRRVEAVIQESKF